MTPAPVLRAGIVGAGWIGRRHAEAIGERDDIAVAAVCDTDPERAAEVAGLSGAEVFAGWQEMLDRTSLDVVWICVPPRAHAAAAVAVLDAGLPLYLEKPIARSLADAAEIVAAAARSAAVCTVGYQWRAIDWLGELRRALVGQTIGCLVGQSVGGTQSRPWFLDRAAGGGNLLERGSHHIDLARALAGEVTAVQAAGSSVRLAPRQGNATDDIDDAVTVMLHFSSGGIGTIVVAWTGDDLPGRYLVELTAPDAALRLDLDPDFRLSGISRGTPVAAACQSPPFERSVGRFVAAVKAGDPGLVLCPPADAARTLAVAVAAEEALRTGRKVPVPG
jgi:predicted dehydrogenase